MGHNVKIHKITPATGKERGDLEIKDYVVLDKPQGKDNRLPPPRTLIMDFTMTHDRTDNLDRFGCSHLHPIGQFTHTRRSDGDPDPDGALKEEVRIKNRHYRSIYLNRPDPIAFWSLTVNTSDRLYDDFIRLLFLHAHREAPTLGNELSDESVANVSTMRISIPLDLSSQSFIPLPRFIRSRHPTVLLDPSLVLFPPRSA